MTVALEQSKRRARHVGVHEEAHGLRGERMKRFLFSQFANKLERSANVLNGKVVFLLDLLETHASGKTANNQCNRHACAANYRLAVANGGINDDASVSVHMETAV
jgi:hypothetical protein